MDCSRFYVLNFLTLPEGIWFSNFSLFSRLALPEFICILSFYVFYWPCPRAFVFRVLICLRFAPVRGHLDSDFLWSLFFDPVEGFCSSSFFLDLALPEGIASWVSICLFFDPARGHLNFEIFFGLGPARGHLHPEILSFYFLILSEGICMSSFCNLVVWPCPRAFGFRF